MKWLYDDEITWDIIICDQNHRFSSFWRKRDPRTDGPTDGRTDRPSYRDARTHLKMERANNNAPFKQEELTMVHSTFTRTAGLQKWQFLMLKLHRFSFPIIGIDVWDVRKCIVTLLMALYFLVGENRMLHACKLAHRKLELLFLRMIYFLPQHYSRKHNNYRNDYSVHYQKDNSLLIDPTFA